jgi:hypothetical protein
MEGPHYSVRPDPLTNMATIGDLFLIVFVNGSELHKQSQQRTFHRCFLPSFGTFGHALHLYILLSLHLLKM